ncbi:MAG: VOC family protein [Robiginitomaculum sp.]|nr:VOC family protein [Robiginitomaculum sp.]
MPRSQTLNNDFTYQEAKPLFLVDDLVIATKFYCDVLGFEKKWAWGAPEIRVGVGPKSAPNQTPFEIHLITDPEIGPSGTSFVYFHVTNIESLYERCRACGANIYLELGDRDWGMKDFRVRDPFGNRMGFGETL